MKTRISRIIKMLCILPLISLFLTGCTSEIKPLSGLELSLAHKQKIPLKVGLYMSPDYCNYSFVTDQIYVTYYTIPLGSTLCHETKIIVEAIFEEVSVFPSLEANDKSINVIMIPEIVILKIQMMGYTHKSEALLIGKWTVVDMNGRLIWVDTFQSHVITTYGDHLPSTLKRAKFVLEDYFQNVFKGIQSWKLWESVAMTK